MRTIITLLMLCSVEVFGQKDSINVVDPFGQKQGVWRLTGAQAPELGVEPTAMAEEGMYLNNQKVGPWIRYDKKGIKPISLIYYQYNDDGSASSRIAMFPFKFYDDGSPQYSPYIGQCPFKANYRRFNTSGKLIELMEYDSAGNECHSITEIDPSELAQLSYFQAPETFKKKIETGIQIPVTTSLSGESGVYIVDFKHTTYVSGTFVNGKLVDGKECVLNEDYTPISIRIFKNGVYVESYFP